MKTSLKFAPLFLAASLPSALAVEIAGVQLPTVVGPLAAFAAFVSSLVVMLVWSDYSRPRGLTRAVMSTASASPKAAHPLAA